MRVERERLRRSMRLLGKLGGVGLVCVLLGAVGYLASARYMHLRIDEENVHAIVAYFQSQRQTGPSVSPGTTAPETTSQAPALPPQAAPKSGKK